MGKITAAQAAEAIRDYGVDLRPYPFSEQPWVNFTTAGGWDPVGVAHHHTTGSDALLAVGMNSSKAAMLRLLRIGRPDLDGPLCHFAPAFMGRGKRTVFAIGWGNTNHAGLIGSRVAAQLRAGTFQGLRERGPETVDGNAILYGLEYLHPGTRMVWPDELVDAGHRTAAALCDAHGWDPKNWAGSNAEHRELTGRKVDRSWVRWGDGMREEIGKLAAKSENAGDAWGRSLPVAKAMEALFEAAAFKAGRGKPRQAAALRKAAYDLGAQFPRLRD